MKVLIVEDEPAAQDYLRHLIAAHFPTLQVVAVEDNVPESAAALRRTAPDLLLLDVDIKLGTGFDVLAACPDQQAEVIFTTAYNQYALDAFRHHAVDYLLKPLDDVETVAAITRSIRRVEERQAVQHFAQLLARLQPAAPALQRLSIPTVEGVDFIELPDLLYAEADGNYTRLHLCTGRVIVTARQLKEVERQLPPPEFFRIHHSYVINCRHVKKYHKGRGGHVTLADGRDLPVASSRKDALLVHFGLA